MKRRNKSECLRLNTAACYPQTHGLHSGAVIFHHPGPVLSEGRSGSQLRPWRMLEAFHESGFEVEAVTGYGTDRRRTIRRLLGEIEKGRRFEFVYCESRSIPTLLTEKHRVPLHPLMDFRFLQKLRNKRVPVGLFYRDVFWRFDRYRDMLPWAGRALTVPLYYYDWWWYQRMVDHLFLPSIRMADYLPTAWPADRLSALPPGAHRPEENCGNRPDEDRRPGYLRILYVGGVQPPTYDLTPLLECVRQVPDMRLTLCCRPKEWQKIEAYYAHLLDERVSVVHVTGNGLAGLYANADLFGLIRKPDVYLDFAVPVKVFESLGYGLPIVTLAGTEAARVVEQHDLGWVASGMAELVAMMRQLSSNPGLMEEKRKSVLSARNRHTWQARVEEIRSQLARYG